MSRQPRDLQQLLVAERDVLGGHLGVRCPQQVLAVQVLLGLCPGGVDPQQPARGDAEIAVQPGLGGDHAAQFGALVPAQRVRAVDQLLELGDQAGADRGVALGGLGVVADDEPLVLGDPHFFDLEVARDVLVPALPGQGGPGLGGAGAELFPDDVVVPAPAEVAAVLPGGEPAVGDPDDPGQRPVPHVVLDLADQRRVSGVPGPAPHPDRDPVPGDGHADDDLGQVVAVVLGVAEGPERRAALAGVPGPGAVRARSGGRAAVRVTGGGLVGLPGLEVGGGRVSKNTRSTSRPSRSETFPKISSPSAPLISSSQSIAR
jgi:hypothetical protein